MVLDMSSSNENPIELKKNFYIIRDTRDTVTHVAYSKNKIIGGAGSSNDNLKTPCGTRIDVNKMDMIYGVGNIRRRAANIECEKCREHLKIELEILSDEGLI